jgi:hypothetical protein
MEEGLPLPTAIEYVPWLKIIFDFSFGHSLAMTAGLDFITV